MYADFSQNKSNVLVQIQGLDNYGDLHQAILDYVESDFPIDKEELASINEDTAEVLVGVMTDIIMVVGDDHDIDFAEEDASLEFAVLSITKIAPSRVLIAINFIDNDAEDEDTDSDWS